MGKAQDARPSAMGGQDQEIKDCPPAICGVKKAFYKYLCLDRYFLSINANYLFSLFSHSPNFPGIQLPCKLREDSCVMFASLPRNCSLLGKNEVPPAGLLLVASEGRVHTPCSLRFCNSHTPLCVSLLGTAFHPETY